MITENQTEVIAFLAAPSTHHGAPVERIDTHTAIVFLAGGRAWKMKRAVRFDYFDGSSIERRRHLCEGEVTINRRTAPDIYRKAVPITREAGGCLALGGAGAPVEWVVEMERFDEEAVLDRMAARGALPLELMTRLGEIVARFHRDAEPRPQSGGAEGMLRVVDGNAAGFEEYGHGVLDEDLCRRITGESRAAIETHRGLLERRRAAGFVRQCHGDLHLRNVVVLRGEPVLFDAIEFNDDIACIDVMYDVAFLLMDLWRRGLPRHANALWNSYLCSSGDLGGIGLLPLFLSCRAAVGAKTSATAAHVHPDRAAALELHTLARRYLVMAEQMLHPSMPRIVAVGGLSGTGKTSLALALAPSIGAVPGAVVLRSDQIRKALFGVSLDQPLGPEGYTAEVSERVYEAMLARVAEIVQGGHSVVADAVHARERDRAALERLAYEARVPFAGFWLEAPGAVLVRRVNARRGDVSDADAAVVRLQQQQDTGPLEWTRIDASLAPAAVRRRVEGELGVGVAAAPVEREVV